MAVAVEEWRTPCGAVSESAWAHPMWGCLRGSLSGNKSRGTTFEGRTPCSVGLDEMWVSTAYLA